MTIPNIGGVDRPWHYNFESIKDRNKLQQMAETVSCQDPSAEPSQVFHSAAGRTCSKRVMHDHDLNNANKDNGMNRWAKS